MLSPRPKRPLALVPRLPVRRSNVRHAREAPVGRQDVIERVDLLLAEGRRLVTLLGSPGMGKTTVAHACLERAPRGGRGAWFCDLTQAKSEEDLLFGVLSLFGGGGREGVVAGGDLATRAGDALAALGPSLLVLDNFEQIVAAAHIVEEWCARAPELSVLVTSRERLAVPSEVVVELPPLACPDPGAPRDEVEASGAVRLFVARAKAAGGAVEGAPADVLAAIVRRLDGIPLAIELAAARTRLLSPAELARRLARGDDVLSGATRRGDERHATLSAAIEWSWGLLSDAEQRALARSSVFAGSFTLEDAEVVAASALDVVAALRDKSLVHATADGRLALYASIREHAARKLEELGPEEVSGARLRHARRFASMARRFNDARSLQGRAPEPELHVELRQSEENLVAALAHVESEPRAPGAVELRAELAVALASLQALPADALVDVLGRALSATSAAGEARAEAQILLARQLVWSSLGRYDECLRDLDAVRASAAAPAGLRTLAAVFLGIQLRFQGDPEGARLAHLEAAPEIAALDLPRLGAMNEACLGRLSHDLGDRAAARAHDERAFDASDAIGDLWLGALALANLAQVEQEEQRFDRAEELLERALSRLRDAGEAHYEAIYSGVCGDLSLEMGRHDVARRWYGQGARFLGRIPAHRQTAVLHAAAASLEATDGDRVAAAAHLDLAERSARRSGNAVARIAVEVHRGVVELALAGGDAALTARLRERARELAEGASPDAKVARVSLDVRFALRLLERALSSASRVTAPPTLRLGPGAAWFAWGDAAPVDLSKRGPLRRLLVTLADRHARAPGRGLAVDALADGAWPGERVLPTAAATRVRVAIATLRRLGLRAALVTREDGYLLDPSVQLERNGESPSAQA